MQPHTTGLLSDPDFRRARASKAARARHSKPAAVDRRVDALAARIKAVVDALPPLTEAQRARLAALLRPADTGGEAA